MDEAEEFELAQVDFPLKSDLKQVYQFEKDVYSYVGSPEHVNDIKKDIENKMKEYERKYTELWQNMQ